MFLKVNYYFWIVTSMYVLVLLYINLRPVILIKGNLSYSKKKKLYLEAKEKIGSRKFTKIIIIVFIIGFIGNLFTNAGADNAKNTTTFYIANNYDDKIIVHSNLDYHILMELENNEFTETYQIVPNDEIGTITLKKLGELTLQDIDKKASD